MPDDEPYPMALPTWKANRAVSIIVNQKKENPDTPVPFPALK